LCEKDLDHRGRRLVRESLKAKLSATFQVELCQDGQSGYYTIYEYKPDLVLLSLTIAQMDPVSLVGKMRAQKQFQKLQILALADQKTLGQADDALAAGAHQAFLKDEEDAIRTITAAISTLMTPSLARRNVALPQLAPALPVLQPAAIPMMKVAEPAAVAAPLNIPAHGWATDHFSLPPRQPSADDERVLRNSGRFQLDYLGDVRTAEDVTVRQVHAFLDGYGQKAHAVRQEFIRYRTAEQTVRRDQLKLLIEKVASLNGKQTTVVWLAWAAISPLFEARVRQLFESANPASPSSLLGLATALDSLAAVEQSHRGTGTAE
jgi:CheY-like chemotaxis protein